MSFFILEKLEQCFFGLQRKHFFWSMFI